MEWLKPKELIAGLLDGHGLAFKGQLLRAVIRRAGDNSLRAQGVMGPLSGAAEFKEVPADFWQEHHSKAGADADWLLGDFTKRDRIGRPVAWVRGATFNTADAIAMGAVIGGKKAETMEAGSANLATSDTPQRAGARRGRKEEYNWSGMIAALLRDADLNGLDDKRIQADWEKWAADWFATEGNGDETGPGVTQIRDKIRPIFQSFEALRSR